MTWGVSAEARAATCVMKPEDHLYSEQTSDMRGSVGMAERRKYKIDQLKFPTNMVTEYRQSLMPEDTNEEVRTPLPKVSVGTALHSPLSASTPARPCTGAGYRSVGGRNPNGIDRGDGPRPGPRLPHGMR